MGEELEDLNRLHPVWGWRYRFSGHGVRSTDMPLLGFRSGQEHAHAGGYRPILLHRVLWVPVTLQKYWQFTVDRWAQGSRGFPPDAPVWDAGIRRSPLARPIRV